ncbi:MAG: tetratricopeptide repeat protein [Chloroflexi bacterium]|nr:tetratricopeptide repeat protein [Chloroflexota bacterium]
MGHLRRNGGHRPAARRSGPEAGRPDDPGRLPVHPLPLFNPIQGETLAEQALSLARELGDSAAEAKILWGLLNLYTHSNRVPQAIACGERTLALAHDLNLREQRAFILNDVALCYWFSGRLDRAGESLREASDLWRELNNLPMLAHSLAGSASLAVDTGDYDLALTFSEEACQISQAIANLWGSLIVKLRSVTSIGIAANQIKPLPLCKNVCV